MELNTEGFYKKPRVISGFKFLTEWGKNDIWLSDISEWEFIQYRPNTQWTAVKL